MEPKVFITLNKLSNHHHFWIENEYLYESYGTIRGLRYVALFAVKGMPDSDNCTEAMINYIEKEYMN